MANILTDCNAPFPDVKAAGCATELSAGNPERAMEGRYANYFEIGQNVFEFVVDFGQLYPDAQPPVIHSRVIIGPAYVRRLLEVLLKAIENYEQRFCKIVDYSAADAAIETPEAPQTGADVDDAGSRSPDAKREQGTEQKVTTMTDGAHQPASAVGAAYEPQKSPRQAIDDLKQKIVRTRGEIASKEREVTSDEAKLTLSESTYGEVQQSLDEYAQVLPHLTDQRTQLSDFLKTRLDRLRAIVSDEKAQQIKAAIKATDDAIAAAARNVDQLAQQRNDVQAKYEEAQRAFEQRHNDLDDARKLKANLDTQLAESAAIKAQSESVSDETQPSRAYFLALELQKSLDKIATPDAAAYKSRLDECWWRLFNAKDPLNSLKAKLADANDQYAAAKTNAAELASKRTETILARMDELDAAAPAPAEAAAVES